MYSAPHVLSLGISHMLIWPLSTRSRHVLLLVIPGHDVKETVRHLGPFFAIYLVIKSPYPHSLAQRATIVIPEPVG